MIALRKFKISECRGIREQEIGFGERSIVLVGANGSGKSSVVDALDFLLTGRIRHLEGEGAGGLSIEAHGKHVDAVANGLVVDATFVVKEVGAQPLEIPTRRTFKPPRLTPEAIPEALTSLFRQARLGHHLLSRRDILRFILAPAGNRREQITTLLEISEVDAQRLELTAATKDAGAQRKLAAAAVSMAERALLGLFDPPLSSIDELEGRINETRRHLELPAIALRTGSVASGLAELNEAAEHPLRIVRAQLDNLSRLATALQLGEGVAAYDAALSGARLDLARVADQQRQLLAAGLALAEGDHCPLCESAQPIEELRGRWRDRLAAAEKAAEEMSRLRSEWQRLRDGYLRVSEQVNAIAAVVARTEYGSPLFALSEATRTIPALPSPEKGDQKFDARPLTQFADALAKEVSSLIDLANKLPPPSETAKYGRLLADAEKGLSDLLEAKEQLERETKLSEFFAALEKSFFSARDGLLDEIYESLAERVEHLYSAVHPSTTPRKTALKATKTGMELEVDFHGRGSFPPAALHSEGQQDVLGICLFLALAERAAGGAPAFLILDDVLMSVDADHRHAMAILLKKEFPSTQFVIATHDEVWARQLRGLGVAAKEVRFGPWTLEGSQLAGSAAETFSAIRDHLAAGRVPSAAHQLRRTLEATLADICDALRASVRYRHDRQYDLGDFFDPGVERMSRLIGKGLEASKAWKQPTNDQEDLKTRFAAARAAVGSEQWSINPTLHYNAWAQMTVNDFAPVVAAYESLLAFFSCSACGGLLREQDTNVRCPCGQRSWNIAKK